MSALGQRISSACGGSIDRAVRPALEMMWLLGGNPHDEGKQAQQRRSLEIYAHEALLADPHSFFQVPPPAQPKRRPLLYEKRISRLSWPSGYRTFDPAYQHTYDGWEANRTAWAEHFHHPRGARGTVICVHSWATGSFLLTREVFPVRELYRAGLDVVLFMLPFHGPRNPKGSRYGGQLFPGTSPQRTNEAFGQAIWDLRALIASLPGPVGVMGQSLGGYVTSLLASVEPNLAFAIPMIPMVDLASLMWELGKDSKHMRKAEERGVTVETLKAVYGVHCPLNLEPLVPKERRLIIAGTGDRVTSPHHVQALWEHWDRCRIHWFPGGHMLHFGRRSAFAEVLSFVDEAVATTEPGAGRAPTPAAEVPAARQPPPRRRPGTRG